MLASKRVNQGEHSRALHPIATPAPRTPARPRSEGGRRGRVLPVADADTESGQGEFDPQAVVRALNARRGAILACYERELSAQATLAGRITVQMTIQEAGNVTGARVTANTTGSAAVATCVARVVGGLRFSSGPVGGSVTYTFPFVFEPTN